MATGRPSACLSVRMCVYTVTCLCVVAVGVGSIDNANTRYVKRNVIQRTSLITCFCSFRSWAKADPLERRSLFPTFFAC